MIWFSIGYPAPITYPAYQPRPALTLKDDTELTHGNIMIRYLPE